MKEIGEMLKEAREAMKLEIEEVASDLKLRPSQIRNIEEGNTDSFSDMLSLKSFIKEYSKYLGLDYEKMVDEFNEFLFDCTSKVSLIDIKKAREAIKSEKNNENKIISPYTKEPSHKKNIKLILLIISVIIVITGIIITISINKEDTTEISYIESENCVL